MNLNFSSVLLPKPFVSLVRAGTRDHGQAEIYEAAFK